MVNGTPVKLTAPEQPGTCGECGHLNSSHWTCEESEVRTVACTPAETGGRVCNTHVGISIVYRACRICSPPHPGAPEGDPCDGSRRRTDAIVAAVKARG